MYSLHVRVIEANDIPKMDIITDTDAYCILRSGSEVIRTYTINNCKHPRWNQEFHFTVSSPTVGSLNITMRDKDVFKDDNISYIDIPYNTIPVGQIIDQWFSMIPFRRVRKGGRLHLLLHMTHAGMPPFVPSNVACPMYQTQPICMIQQQPTYVGAIPCFQQQPTYIPAYPQPTYIAQTPGYPPPLYPGQPTVYYTGYPPY